MAVQSQETKKEVSSSIQERGEDLLRVAWSSVESAQPLLRFDGPVCPVMSQGVYWYKVNVCNDRSAWCDRRTKMGSTIHRRISSAKE